MTPNSQIQTAPDEQFVVYDCAGEPCIGVIAGMHGAMHTSRVAVIIVVGGPQYRVGSHRQFVTLARALAIAGFPVLRFDYRGMGDSGGDARAFDDVHDDIGAAVNAMQTETGATRIVLCGLCDGASAALMYAASDPRIAGVIALNPWARSPKGEATARIRHYYLRRMVSGAFWRKLLTGNFDIRQGASDFAGTVHGAAARTDIDASPRFLRRMNDGWSRFRGRVLFVLSGQDLTAREFESWVAADRQREEMLNGSLAEVYRCVDADHTLSRQVWRTEAINHMIKWMGRIDSSG